jgi:cell division protein FtsW (lipid II flippase)
MKGRKRDPAWMLISVMMLFFFSAFLLISFQKEQVNWQGLLLSVAVPAMIFIGSMVLPRLFPADKLLLSLTNFLCALGVLLLYRIKPQYGLDQAVRYGVGLVCMLITILVVHRVNSWRWIAFAAIFLSLGALALPIAIGTTINGAKSWISIAGQSLQPSELVKLSYLVVLAYYMSRHRMLPWLFLAVGCLGLLMLQKDLGTALMYYSSALFLFYASTSNLPLTMLGVAGGAGAAVAGYEMFDHVRRRIAAWRNPWGDYQNTGFQIVQSLIAIASGGFFGVGLGLGSPRDIPEYTSDFIFAVLCEQFGIIFGLCVLLIYVVLILRGVSIALASRESFHALLAMGCVVILGVQTFVIIGGVIKLIPLTGVTMPFVSEGGTSLVSCLCLIGMLQGVASRNEDLLKEDARLASLGVNAS